MHHPTDRIAHTTAFITPVVEHWLEREIAQWVHPMKDRSDDPSHHERTLLPRSYISLLYMLTVLQSYSPTGHVNPTSQLFGYGLNDAMTNGRVDSGNEGNVLFNDALDTFNLRLYVVGHMVKDH